MLITRGRDISAHADLLGQARLAAATVNSRINGGELVAAAHGKLMLSRLRFVAGAKNKMRASKVQVEGVQAETKSGVARVAQGGAGGAGGAGGPDGPDPPPDAEGPALRGQIDKTGSNKTIKVTRVKRAQMCKVKLKVLYS